MKKTSALILIILAFAASSCQKLLLPEVPRNSPVANFESMWKGYDEYYGMFEARHINWDSLYTIYRPKVHEGMTNAELYTVLCQLITPLNDIHAFLQPTSDGLLRYESSAFIRSERFQQDFSLDLIRNKYVPGLVFVDETLQYGIIRDSIGYIHFSAFDKPISFYRQQLEKIMLTLRDTKRMIVDIRDHAGGDDRVSRYVAGWFTQNESLFMTTRKRNGPNRDNFTTPESWVLDRQGDIQYTKSIKLLTTRWTASAGETFTWAMNTQSHVEQVGDTTAGGFTDVISRELPNGWLYFVGVGDYRNASGQSLEGIGIAPQQVVINSKDDIQSGRDRVLEAAIN